MVRGRTRNDKSQIKMLFTSYSPSKAGAPWRRLPSCDLGRRILGRTPRFDSSRRRRVGFVRLKCRAQEPMVLESLDKLIAVHHYIGKVSEDVGIDLHLVIQVTCNVGEAVEGAAQFIRQVREIRIGVDEGR